MTQTMSSPESTSVVFRCNLPAAALKEIVKPLPAITESMYLAFSENGLVMSIKDIGNAWVIEALIPAQNFTHYESHDDTVLKVRLEHIAVLLDVARKGDDLLLEHHRDGSLEATLQRGQNTRQLTVPLLPPKDYLYRGLYTKSSLYTHRITVTGEAWRECIAFTKAVLSKTPQLETKVAVSPRGLDMRPTGQILRGSAHISTEAEDVLDISDMEDEQVVTLSRNYLFPLSKIVGNDDELQVHVAAGKPILITIGGREVVAQLAVGLAPLATREGEA